MKKFKGLHFLIILLMSVSLSLGGIQDVSAARTSGAEKSRKKKVERIVYGAAFSPYVRKVLVTLHEKKMAYTLKEVLPTAVFEFQKKPVPEDFKAASPLGKIPAYQEGVFTLADSAAIVAYLDKTSGRKGSLYPKNPKKYAKALWWQRYADNDLTHVITVRMREEIGRPKIMGPYTPNRKLIEEAAKKTEKMFDYLESEVPGRGWMMGRQFTIADIALASPFRNYFDGGDKIDAARWPKLAAYIDRVFARPSFKAVYQKHHKDL